MRATDRTVSADLVPHGVIGRVEELALLDDLLADEPLLPPSSCTAPEGSGRALCSAS
jgi:hypothetical protein